LMGDLLGIQSADGGGEGSELALEGGDGSAVVDAGAGVRDHRGFQAGVGRFTIYI
jgi:hypothetical protein